MMVHEIENHEAILDEIYMEVPDPEDSGEVRAAIEGLLWKHAKKH